MDELKKYDVTVSKRARNSLIKHAKFLAQVSIEAAQNLFDRFEEKVISLERMPERCSFYYNPYVNPAKYRKLELGNYLLILFQIKGNVVQIDLIIDTRTNV